MSDPATGAVLEARGLGKTYQDAGGRLTVLAGIDLRLVAGDQLAITGQSGSGKSTLLHLLGGLDRPSAGEVRIDGQPLDRLGARALGALRGRAVGFVYQFHHLIAELTAVENIALPLLMRSLPPRQARAQAQALLERLGLGGRGHHKPGELSGGERQRVAIGRALIARPRVVLADEPTGNLDPHTAGAVFDLLIECCAQVQGALVVVTHNPNLAARLRTQRTLRDGHLAAPD